MEPAWQTSFSHIQINDANKVPDTDEHNHAHAETDIPVATWTNGERGILDSATTRLIAEGATVGRRNKSLFAAACDLAGCGYEINEAVNKLTNIMIESGLSQQEITTAIKSAYTKKRSMASDDITDTLSHLDRQFIDETGNTPTLTTDTNRRGAAKPLIRKIVENVNIVQYEDEKGKAKMAEIAKPINAVAEEVLEAAGGWPSRCQGSLFAVNETAIDDQTGLPRPDSINYIKTPAALFAWLQSEVTLYWSNKQSGLRADSTGMPQTIPTKGEFFEHLRSSSSGTQLFDAVSPLRHEPAVPGIFYVPHKLPPPGEGEWLKKLVLSLNPETAEDRRLMLAALLTPGWGGEAGTRPAFVFTSQYGRGAGKSATTAIFAEIWGGGITIGENEDWTVFRARLLDDSSLSKRIVLRDNIKKKVSGSDIEGLLTSQRIDGKKMYVGNFVRPNLLTWYMTANTPRLSKDIADRSIIIEIGSPTHADNWLAETMQMVREHRHNILADLFAILEGPDAPGEAIGEYDRWQSWQRGVLAKIDGAADLARITLIRRQAVDVDLEESEEIVGTIQQELDARGHTTSEKIRIPHADMVDILRDKGIVGRAMSAKAVGTYIQERTNKGGVLDCLSKDPCHSFGRTWIWTGSAHTSGPAVPLRDPPISADGPPVEDDRYWRSDYE